MYIHTQVCIYSDTKVDRIFFWRVRDLCWMLELCFAKNDFDRDEKRVKTEGFENIPTIFVIFLKISFENVRYSIYSRTTIYIHICDIFTYASGS